MVIDLLVVYSISNLNNEYILSSVKSSKDEDTKGVVDTHTMSNFSVGIRILKASFTSDYHSQCLYPPMIPIPDKFRGRVHYGVEPTTKR